MALAAVAFDKATLCCPVSVCRHWNPSVAGVSSASGSVPLPDKVTGAPSATSDWSAPAFAIGASLRLSSRT